MRFMIIVKASPETEAGIMPGPEAFEAMAKFNDELIDAGVMLAGDGLYPSKDGARVTSLGGGKLQVVDGPFAETKELIAGFWIITAKDKEEALSWVKRIPFADFETIELRRVYESADFAGAAPDELIEKEEAWRAANEKPVTR
jgi:hypothetical protein